MESRQLVVGLGGRWILVLVDVLTRVAQLSRPSLRSSLLHACVLVDALFPVCHDCISSSLSAVLVVCVCPSLRLLSAVLGKRSRDDTGGGVPAADKKRKKIAFPVHAEMNFLGLIIGPKGQTQKAMEQASGARILVRGRGASKEGEEGSEEDMHVLIVADDEQQLSKAEELVNDLLYNPDKASQVKSQQLKEVAAQHAAADGTPYHVSSPPMYGGGGAADGVKRTSEIRVPGSSVGLVIGKMGETIRQLEGMTGCEIQVARENRLGEDDRVVTLRGTDEQVARAHEEINKVVAGGPSNRSSGAPSYSQAGLGYGGGNSFTVHIPNVAVGLLIGRSGETIRSLQARTGCSVQVQRNSDVAPGSDTREVVLSGREDQIDMARREIDMIIQDKQASMHRGPDDRAGAGSYGVGGGGGDGGGGGGGGRGGGGGGSASTSIIVRVPNTAVGTIIGRAGETIKRLQQMTNARIQIDRNQDAEEREITISGGVDDVERARVEVDELIRQKQSGGGMVPPPGGYGPPAAYGRAPPAPYGHYPPPTAYGYPPYDPYAPPGYPPYGYYPPSADYAAAGYAQPPPGADNGQYAAHSAPPPAQPTDATDPASAATVSSPSSASNQPQPAAATVPAGSAAVALPTPPTDQTLFAAYWAGLSYEQQQEYYRQYYPEMLTQIIQQQQQQPAA